MEFDLVINLKTAEQINVVIPPDVVKCAAKLIN